MVHKHLPKQILESKRLSMRDKALLLAMITCYSFDAEGLRAFYAKHWPSAADMLGIAPLTAARIWVKVRDLDMLEPAAGDGVFILVAPPTDGQEATQ